MTEVAVDMHIIAERLEAVHERMVLACQRAGRRPEDVTLVGVSKTFPVEMVQAAYEAGLRDLGESKVQELTVKAGALPGAYLGGDVRWHMIGHLQRNKAKDVVAVADLFHALDSPRLAKELNKRAGQEGRVMPCLVQVNVSGEESKYGLDPQAASRLVDAFAAYDQLRIVGLMTLAAPADDPADVRPQFRRLRELFEACRRLDHPRVRMEVLSMGMSGDFEVAIEEGATHVRVGTAIFGPRHR